MNKSIKEMNEHVRKVMAEIKAKNKDNPKFQAFMAAVEKRKAELAKKEAEKAE